MTDEITNVTTDSTATTTSSDTTTNPVDNVSTPQEAVEEMIKLKVLGEEKEYPRSEVLKLAQQGLGANRKFEEVAKARKELEAFTKNLVDNPRDFLRNHPNREAILQASQELLAEYVEEQEKYNAMSDSERRAVELQKELDRRQKELDERDNRIKQQLQEHYRNQFQSEIIAALKDTELPVTEGSIIRIANLYKQALNNGINTNFQECAKIVERDYLGYLDDISKNREKAQKQKQKLKVVSSNPTPKKERKKISMEDFHKKLENMIQ